jgi:hypothetical protein
MRQRGALGAGTAPCLAAGRVVDPDLLRCALSSRDSGSTAMGLFFRGAAKKKIDGPPRAFTKSQTHPPTPPTFFFMTFFFSTFLGVSRQGEFKNTIQMFLEKVHVENVFQNFDKNFRCQFFLDFFLFYRVLGCFSAMGVQKHYKKRFTKKIVSKRF